MNRDIKMGRNEDIFLFLSLLPSCAHTAALLGRGEQGSPSSLQGGPPADRSRVRDNGRGGKNGEIGRLSFSRKSKNLSLSFPPICRFLAREVM